MTSSREIRRDEVFSTVSRALADNARKNTAVSDGKYDVPLINEGAFRNKDIINVHDQSIQDRVERESLYGAEARVGARGIGNQEGLAGQENNLIGTSRGVWGRIPWWLLIMVLVCIVLFGIWIISIMLRGRYMAPIPIPGAPIVNPAVPVVSPLASPVATPVATPIASPIASPIAPVASPIVPTTAPAMTSTTLTTTPTIAPTMATPMVSPIASPLTNMMPGVPVAPGAVTSVYNRVTTPVLHQKEQPLPTPSPSPASPPKTPEPKTLVCPPNSFAFNGKCYHCPANQQFNGQNCQLKKPKHLSRRSS